MSTDLHPTGTNRAFAWTRTTNAPDEIWALWTDASTWAQWDLGLRSARSDGPLREGATGTIRPLFGGPASFRVVEWVEAVRYAFETALPGSRLLVERSLGVDRKSFTHRVSFVGLSSPVLAALLGPGFRKRLVPTMNELALLAERRSRS